MVPVAIPTTGLEAEMARTLGAEEVMALRMGAQQEGGFTTVNSCHALRLSFPKLAPEKEEALAALFKSMEGLRWEDLLAHSFKGSLRSLRRSQVKVGSAASLPSGEAPQSLQFF